MKFKKIAQLNQNHMIHRRGHLHLAYLQVHITSTLFHLLLHKLFLGQYVLLYHNEFFVNQQKCILQDEGQVDQLLTEILKMN